MLPSEWISYMKIWKILNNMKTKLKKFVFELLKSKLVTIEENTSLNGKIIVITGGTKGIGEAIGNVLEMKGATCIRIARSVPQNIVPKNEGMYVIADVTNKDDVCNKFNNIIEKYGKIDVLVNNVGSFLNNSLESIDEKDFDNIVSTNIKSIFLTSQAVLPFMKKNKQGLIINVGSKISHNTQVAPKKVLYAMTKYAVEGFSFALNREVKPFGLRVSCIMPGTVNTFISRNQDKFLSPFEVGKVVLMIIENEGIDFESIIFKAVKQDI